MNMSADKAFDEALGFRLMVLRQKHKMSQEGLGARLGVRYQQVQKYETGKTRMTAARIAACARIFGVPAGYFYGEAEAEDAGTDLTEQAVFNAAVEITGLPPAICQDMRMLARTINRMWQDRSNDNAPGTAEHKEDRETE